MTLTWATTIIYLCSYISGYYAAKSTGFIGFLMCWGFGVLVFFAMRNEIGL